MRWYCQFLTLTFNAGSNTCSVKYSPMTYCYNILNKTTDATFTDALKNVCRALYVYWQKAS
ncbi:MAG: hypothetical protein J6Z43_06275 [Clostridiales bacterium]|nr:hypothetical protein [Clostridiales bacterium]